MPRLADLNIPALILARGQAEASGPLALAQINADALRQRGNITAQLLSGIGQTIGSLPAQFQQSKLLDQQQQFRGLQMQQMQGDLQDRDMARRASIVGANMMRDAMTSDESGAVLFDTGKLAQMMAVLPPDVATRYIEHADKLNEITKNAVQARNVHLADILNEGAKVEEPSGVLADGVEMMLANKLITQQEADQARQMTSQMQTGDPKDIRQRLIEARNLLAPQKYGKPIESGPDKTFLDPGTLRPVGSTPGKVPTTTAEFEWHAANPSSPFHDQAVKALETARTQQAPQAPHSLEQQLLEAISTGDKGTAARITSTMQAAAQARQDPTAQATLQVLRNLSAAEASERLKKLQEENQPLNVSNNLITTASGRKYIDLGEFQTPTEREKARKAADAAGVRAVNKDTADSLRAADNARANFNAIWTQISPYLPKDASGRLIGGPKNTLERIFQTNPVLGAYGSWRTAAIQAVQGLAEKGMGLRLNRSEIDLMLNNDIPQPTDDAPTAYQRIQNMLTMLDNKEHDLLDRDRRAGATAAQPLTVGGFTVREK